MRRTPTTFRALLAAALLLLTPALAAADGPSAGAVVKPLTTEDLNRIGSATTDAALICNLGFIETPISSTPILLAGNEYYSLVRPGQCAACSGTNAARLTRAFIGLDFRNTCTVTIQYALVGNAGDELCPIPDRNTTLCATGTKNYTATTKGAQLVELVLPDSCQFQGSAFLKVTFPGFPPGCDDPNTDLLVGTTPMSVLINSRTACSSYRYDGTMVDLCGPSGTVPGNPMVYAEAWSCFVPNLRRSWGSLKIRYQ